jgi:LuxR family maltose regulon positive regulatory protein
MHRDERWARVATVAAERIDAGNAARARNDPFRGEVRRSRLLERLLVAADRRLVAIAAPAGYGKTTLLRQWAAADHRPFALVGVDDASNDPGTLLVTIARALDAVEPGAQGLGGTRSAGSPEVASILHIGAALATRTIPCVLAIDDVHHLHSGPALRVIWEVIDALPPGSQLVLSGRSDRALDLELGPGRALETPMRLGASDLALDATEGELLLSAAGLALDNAQLEALMGRTEGWAAGLAYATSALLPTTDVEAFGGGDRRLAEYVMRDVLRDAGPPTVDFLLRTSVLEELNTSLCDAVTERSDGLEMLEQLDRERLFVAPLDTRAERFRYHRLFRDVLQHELRRRDARAEPRLNRRASAWYTTHGRFEPAIRHSLAAADFETAARLVWTNAATCVARGRPATLRRWLAAFSDDQIAGHPLLALTAASVDAVEGRADEATNWLWLTQHGSGRAAERNSAFESHVALLEALLTDHGLTGMREQADLAYSLERDTSPWRAVAGFYVGLILHLAGEGEAARARLEDTLVRSAVLWPTVHANCLAELALLDAERGAWDLATDRARQARRYADERRLGAFAPMAIVPAVDALTLAHHGEARRARESMEHALRLLKSLGRVGPPVRAEAYAVLARVSLLSGDTTAAKELLRDLRPLVAAMPEAAGLRARVAELDADLQVVAEAIVGPLALTAAELRVLGYLPMHLSMSEIAEHLFVSRNTVKSQAIAIYRKLAVSSRGGAVARARELGLLDV